MTERLIPLLKSILDSALWQYDSDTRIVWITMLAMSDRTGYVGASLSGLASRARVPLESARSAVARFSERDDDSSTPDHDGRRIEKVSRGWRILNYSKFSDLRDEAPSVPVAYTRPEVPCPDDLLDKLEKLGEVDKLALRYSVDRSDIVAEVCGFVDYWTSPERTSTPQGLSNTWFTRIRSRIAGRARDGMLRGAGGRLEQRKPSKAADEAARLKDKIARLEGKK